MKIEVLRYKSHDDYTLGKLYIDGTFKCYTLEDEKRSIKVWGETRIPDGTYNIKLRKEGGFHSKYLKKFGSTFHKGMLWLQDVPGFEYILIHIGNTDKDTAGCILVGKTVANAFIGNSTGAYKEIYPIIADAISNGEDVSITLKEI